MYIPDENVAAVTKDGVNFPGFISINRKCECGSGVTITIREDGHADETTGYPVCGKIVELKLTEKEWISFLDQVCK